MKKTLLTLAAAFCALPMFAQQISVDEASRTAQQFFGTGTRSVSDVELAYTSTVNGKNHFFVFNSPANNGGFVIVGADQAAKEILGYSHSGTFDYNNLPDNFRWWLSQYDLQIEEGIKQGVNAREMKSGTRTSKTDIPELIKTKWNQSYPFNRQLPDIFDNTSLTDYYNRLVTGCVATAMAQIMNYHQYPEKATGGVVECYRTLNGVTFQANFGSISYDWSNMKLTYTGKEDANDASVLAVANLMYHCGVSVNMNYNTPNSGGSGAAISKVAGALTKYFYYDKGIQYLVRDLYTDTDWENIVYSELAAGRPVLYGGQAENGGHAFICDGYSTATDTQNMYHFNWGWGGYCDGYYDITGAYALKPNGNGIGGAGDDAQYTGGQEIVIGIQKDKGNDYKYSMAWIDATYIEVVEGQNVNKIIPRKLNTPTVNRGDNIIIQGGFQNTSIVNINANLSLKLMQDDNKPIYLPIKTVNLSPNDYNYGSYNISTKDVPTGVYKITVAFSIDNGCTWTEMSRNLTNEGVLPEYDEVTIERGNKEFFITSTPTFGNNEYIVNDYDKFNLSFNVLCNKTSVLTTTFKASLFEISKIDDSGNFSYYTTPRASGTTEVTFDADEEKTVQIKFAQAGYYSLNEGKTYFVELYNVDSSNKEESIDLGKTVILYVVAEKIVPYTISASGYGTLILPFEAEIPSGLKAYVCESNNGDDLVLREVEKLDMFTPYILSGTAGEYSFSGPDVPGEPTYKVGLLKGILASDYALKADDYVLQTQSGKTRFYKVGDKAGKTATPNRCVLNIPSGSMMSYSSFGLGDEGGTTEIEDIEENEPVVTGIYSLDGTLQTSLQKGINIVRKSDGTTVKVLVK